MNTSKFKWIQLAMMLALSLLALSLPLSAQPATGVACTYGPNFSLTAQTGYIDLSDGNTVYMWSYGLTGGSFQYPGPILCANEGDTVTITLQNNLPYSLPTSLIFPGQENVMADGALSQPEYDGGGNLTSLAQSVVSGGSVTYSFIATHPGTFIYESGTDTKTQVPMGLASVLIVRPAIGANFVDNRSSDRFTPEEEFMAFLSEVDPYQHEAWGKSLGKGKNFNLQSYKARYYLLNGRTLPDTLAPNYAPWLPSQPYGALARIHPFNNDPGAGAAYHPYPAVERFVNVGTEEYPFHPHGQNGLLVNRDGWSLEGPGGQDLTFDNFLNNIGPGQTWDIIFEWYDAEHYSPTNPVNIDIPDLVNMTVGGLYSGSPYLGVQQTMPPGVSTINQCGEYYIISHNHALHQLDGFGTTLVGPITFLRIDPPLPNNCP